MDDLRRLSIDGMGIVFFSAETMGNVAPGTNFLTEEFTQPDQIAAHIKKGDITAFCTGTGGDFDLHFLTGCPFAEVLQAYPVSIRLGLHVQGGWNTDFPQDQVVPMADGFYDMTVCTRRPESGYWGENQTIRIYFNQVDAMRELSWTGVPYLFTED